MVVSLLLGPVLFEGFELPARISWGGRQRLAVHALPGGARVIDAMGRDDAPLRWSGVFSGEDAAVRARLLDGLRSGGLVWPLSWDSFFYSVVVSEFRADFSRPNWIPYRVSCTVLVDELEAALDGAVSVLADLFGDLSAAAAAGVDVTAPTAALGVAGATTAGTAAQAGAQGALGAAAGGNAAGLTAATVSDVSDAGSLAQAGVDSGALAQQALAQGYLARAATNLSLAGS